MERLTAEYRALNQEFYPTHVFEPTSEPDPAFNRLMMADLHRTREYFFRGFSGRHAAARLLLSHAEWELRACSPIPGVTPLSAAGPLSVAAAGFRSDYDAICEQLHDEIRIGLVGLFLARSRCSRVDITVVGDPALDRLDVRQQWCGSRCSAPRPVPPHRIRRHSGSPRVLPVRDGTRGVPTCVQFAHRTPFRHQAGHSRQEFLTCSRRSPERR